MIVINKNSTNRVMTTLSESPYYANGNGTNYLVVFTNKINDDVKYFQATEVSPYVSRYSLFFITESDTPEDTLVAAIHLTGNTQEQSYKIYPLSTPCLTQNDLDVAYSTYSASTQYVESGLVRVIGMETGNTINSVYL